MQTNGCDGQGVRALRRDLVAIVTGASFRPGREIARGLAGWGWALVVVYLDQRLMVEATVAEILATKGTIVTVRADLSDDLDVQRLFAESRAVFGGVDVVVHTTTASAALLYQHAAREVRRRGMIVSVSPAECITFEVERQLCERGICVGRTSPEHVLSLLTRWGEHTGC